MESIKNDLKRLRLWNMFCSWFKVYRWRWCLLFGGIIVVCMAVIAGIYYSTDCMHVRASYVHEGKEIRPLPGVSINVDRKRVKLDNENMYVHLLDKLLYPGLLYPSRILTNAAGEAEIKRTHEEMDISYSKDGYEILNKEEQHHIIFQADLGALEVFGTDSNVSMNKPITYRIFMRDKNKLLIQNTAERCVNFYTSLKEKRELVGRKADDDIVIDSPRGFIGVVTASATAYNAKQVQIKSKPFVVGVHRNVSDAELQKIAGKYPKTVRYNTQQLELFGKQLIRIGDLYDATNEHSLSFNYKKSSRAILLIVKINGVGFSIGGKDWDSITTHELKQSGNKQARILNLDYNQIEEKLPDNELIRVSITSKRDENSDDTLIFTFTIKLHYSSNSTIPPRSLTPVVLTVRQPVIIREGKLPIQLGIARTGEDCRDSVILSDIKYY